MDRVEGNMIHFTITLMIYVKILVQTKRTTSKNQILDPHYLNSKKNSNSQKLLINFHEPERYFLRFPILLHI